MFDSVTAGDQLPSVQLRQPSPTATSAPVDRQHEAPQTYEDLLAANTSLKTRVSELDLINGLFRGRVTELEQSDAAARRSEMILRDSEVRLRRSLDDAQRREEELKRRVSELEHQVGEQSGGSQDNPLEPLAKKMKLADVVEQPSSSPAKSLNADSV